MEQWGEARSTHNEAMGDGEWLTGLQQLSTRDKRARTNAEVLTIRNLTRVQGLPLHDKHDVLQHQMTKTLSERTIHRVPEHIRRSG